MADLTVATTFTSRTTIQPTPGATTVPAPRSSAFVFTNDPPVAGLYDPAAFPGALLPRRIETCTGPLFHSGGFENFDCAAHDLATNCGYYVCIPARTEGIYTSADEAKHQTDGVSNGSNPRFSTLAEAKHAWADACVRWHGPICTRERLEREDQIGTFWVLKGHDGYLGSRMAAFHLADKLDLAEIHILGSNKLEELEIFLDPEADEDNTATKEAMEDGTEDDGVLV
ncbi:hypothetical protein B0H19DRAFT_1261720 [Mycena capillaripes]|nr:hypothetical protein B0H19DRAFT_1261720 [Mycena capillaripes]